MTSAPAGQLVKAVVREVLEQKGTPDQDVRDESKLYEDGLGLDSLDTATLSAALEREFGNDPYTKGQFPRTVGELVQYFEG